MTGKEANYLEEGFGLIQQRIEKEYNEKLISYEVYKLRLKSLEEDKKQKLKPYWDSVRKREEFRSREGKQTASTKRKNKRQKFTKIATSIYYYLFIILAIGFIIYSTIDEGILGFVLSLIVTGIAWIIASYLFIIFTRFIKMFIR